MLTLEMRSEIKIPNSLVETQFMLGMIQIDYIKANQGSNVREGKRIINTKFSDYLLGILNLAF